MRIAIVVTDLTPPRMGGISKVASEITKRFLHLGHEVTVFCLPRTADAFPAMAGLTLVPVQSRWSLYKDYPVMSFSIAAFGELLAHHARRSFDVSHAMNFNNFGYSFYARKMRAAGLAHVSTGFESTGMEIHAKWREFKSRPTLHCFLQMAMESFLAPWQRLYIGRADAITTEDAETRGEFLAMGLSGEKIHLIPSGVDVEHMLSYQPGETARPAGPVVLCPGRVDTRKGSQFAIRAFAQVLKQFPSARLVLAGGGRGDYIQAMRRLVDQLGLAASVEMTGPVDDLRPHYHACDVVLIPSLSEGIPITLQEAVIFRKPVVCSRLTGTHDFAGHLPAIRWATPGDPDDLAQQLCATLQEPPPARDLDAGFEFMKNHDWQHVAKRYLEVYQLAKDALSRTGK